MRFERGIELISQEDIQKVREATDLVSLVSERVPVRQKGKDFWACCPLHHEKTPSFKMDPVTQLWHCFGCNEGGGVFDFVMKLDDLSFPESVRKLAERAHIEIQEKNERNSSSSSKQRLKDACEEAASFYHLQLMRGRGEGAAKAREYLSSRGLGGDIPNIWNLGFAPGGNSLVQHLSSKGFSGKEMIEANLAVAKDGGKLRDRFFNRAMFPIRDISGDVIAFGGRILGKGEPKYLNSQETPIFHKSNVLYGLDKAKASMASTGIAIVTEGYTDVIAMHKAGISNTVASLGTSLTQSHVRALSRHATKGIVYIFDGDEAGQRATERALQFIDQAITPESGSKMIDLKALSLPDGLDPADFLEAHSAEELKELIKNAQPLVLFGIQRRISRYDISTAEGRAKAASDALDVLAPIKDSILAKDYARQIASILSLREEDVIEALASIKPPRRYDGNPQNRGGDSFPSSNSEQETHQDISRSLSSKELSRIKTEREFLGLCAQNPLSAISNAEALSQVLWHSAENANISREMLSLLAEHPAIAASELISGIQAKVPNAASQLTEAAVNEGVKVEDMVSYLVRELQIGDLEQRLSLLRGESTKGSESSEPDSSFQEIVELQSALNELKSSHKLPE